MKRYLTISLIIHALILLWLVESPVPSKDDPPLEIRVIDVTPRKANGKVGNEVVTKKRLDLGVAHSPTAPTAESDEIGKALEEYDESIHSPLTSKEHIYSAFYRRMGEAVYYRWKQCLEKTLRRRRIFKKHVTLLRIILDKEGRIENVLVVKPSENDELDECGIKAFLPIRQFPNVPKEMVDSDGKVRINWLLTVE